MIAGRDFSPRRVQAVTCRCLERALESPEFRGQGFRGSRHVQDLLVATACRHTEQFQAHDLASPGARSISDMAVPEEHVSLQRLSRSWVGSRKQSPSTLLLLMYAQDATGIVRLRRLRDLLAATGLFFC